MRFCLLLFCFLLLELPASSQKADTSGEEGRIPSFRLGARGHYGFIMPHHQKMRHLVQGHVRTAALFIERPTSGRKAWQRNYRRPSWGITASYTDLGNPEMLGNAFALFPYLDFPLLKGNAGGLFFRAGTGFGWIQKPFDRKENYKNIAIGSKANITFSFMLHGKWSLPGRWSLSAGLALDHYSNMAIAVPNLGINLPALQLGLARGVGGDRRVGGPRGKKGALDLDKRGIGGQEDPWRITLTGGAGVKGASPPNGELFPAVSLMGYLGRNVSQKSQLGIGPDVDWDRTLSYLAAEGDPETEPEDFGISEESRVGVKAAYALVIDRLRLIGQWGVYLYNPYEKEGPFYHRFGVRYDLGRLLINGTLKTHFANADHFELGVGYRFKAP